MKQVQTYDIEKGENMDQNVAIEILHDMYFISKLFEIQSRLEDEWLRDYYTKIAVPYLSIIIHECFQAGVLDKNKWNKDTLNLLKTIRQRIVKLVPSINSNSIKKIIDSMGIDFDYYCFDLQLAVNESNNRELFDIGFTYYDLLQGTRNMKNFDSLIRIPLQLVENILKTESFCKYSDAITLLFQGVYFEISKTVSTEISLKKYSYSSSVFFKYPEIHKEDKLVVLYYFTLVKQAILLDVLIPESKEESMKFFDTKRAKCKFRAIVIENIGQFLKAANSSLAEEMRRNINKVITPSFFSVNRSIKNNIHYKKITEFDQNDIQNVYVQQELYLKIVLNIFEEKIKYNVGLKYKLIRFIADKTDATMIEVRKMNPKRKKLEDVTVEEWEEAKERLRKKTNNNSD